MLTFASVAGKILTDATPFHSFPGFSDHQPILITAFTIITKTMIAMMMGSTRDIGLVRLTHPRRIRVKGKEIGI